MAQSQTSRGAPRTQAATAGFEFRSYYTGGRPTHGESFTARMNELGAAGFQLVAASGDTLYFSRAVAPPPSEPPVNVDVPSVQPETADVGDTLTVTMGNWDNMGTGEVSYAYQWKRGTSNIGNGTPSYTVTTADAGYGIACVVTATNEFGSTAAPPSNSVAIPGAARR